MTTLKLILLMSIVLFTENSVSKEPFYEERERGWYWYEDPVDVTEEKVVENNEVSGSIQKTNNSIDPFNNMLLLETGYSSEQIIQAQQKAYESAYQNAVVHPSKENILTYLDVTQKVMNQSQSFADTFRKTLWVSPQYDYSLTGRPNKAQALLAYNQSDQKNKADQLKVISDTKGIVYFFRSDCPYCNRFSPILKKFSDEYGFTIIPVSLDGKGSESFRYPKKSHYLADKLQVDTVPATFIVDPDTNSVSTVGYGYMDWSDLIERVIFANEQINLPDDMLVGEIQ